MKKLIGMVETVPEHPHAKFLQQIPTLGMFVPCDEEGNVLEEPDSIGVGNEFYYERALDQYQQAEQRVIFEGWELNQKDISKLENIICITKDKTQLTFFKVENGVFLDNLITNKTFEIKTIEDLVPYNLILK